MPRNTLNSNGMNTGSNYQFGDKMISPNFPRSAFDLSHLVTRDIQQSGLVFPISVLEALPASDYSISVNSLIRVLPQVVPLMSKQRLYLYAFYSRCSDLWDKFQTFLTKGYSGNEILHLPTALQSASSLSASALSSSATNPVVVSASSGDKAKIQNGSLGDYFGLPLDVLADGGIHSALPAMMYLRIWRDYFCNRNYYIDDKRILPDDDSRFRLVSDGSSGVADIGSFKDNYDSSSDDSSVGVYADLTGLFSSGWSSSSSAWISSKGMQYIDISSASITGYKSAFVIAPFYHDYPDDYFTSALPWAQRGDTSVANGTAIDFSSALASGVVVPAVSTTTIESNPLDVDITHQKRLFKSLTSGISSLGSFRILHGDSTDDTNGFLVGNYPSDTVATYNDRFSDWLSRNLFARTGTNPTRLSEGSLYLKDFNLDFSLNLEMLRELAVNQTIQEKMARTDGSYGEFGLTFYGERSKSAMDYRPLFIGGSTTSVIFTEVLQTSQSSDSSPLGTYAGHGVSVNNDGFLGRFHSDDYGYIMILGCIMPDVYYSQGLERMWTRELQSDWFLPERAQLGMRPILNKELYLQADTVLDTDSNPVNENLWAYQDIYDEYRYRPNRVGGQMAQTDKISFYPFTQSRKFGSLPNYGQEFARADDVRTDYLSANNESPYLCQFDVNIRAVQPLPYRARPASIVAM